MSSPWTDLLFLHGHFHDWRLARTVAGTPSPADDTDVPADRPSNAAPLAWWRLCLGIGDGEVHRR